MDHRFINANGIRFHYVEEGVGPLILLLHGFPDFWYSWRKQITAVASAGFRVVAPDLRGYNLSDRPAGVSSYRLDLLADDIAAMINALHGEAPMVVGHDWGGVIAWHLAIRRPDALRGLVVLNAPHPAPFSLEIRRFSSQIFRSLYALFFQLPKIPEALLSAWNFAFLKFSLRRGPVVTEDDLAAYLAAFSPPGALTAALNYYRANFRHALVGEGTQVRVPTLVLWGRRDPFLSPRLAEGLEEWVDDPEVVFLPEAGHWLHLSHAPEVNDRLLAFVRRIRI